MRNNTPHWQQAMELMKDQIKEAGLNMEIQVLEFATIVTNALKGEYQAAGIVWIGDVDPDGYVYPLFYTKAGFNIAQYSNPQMDRLLNEGRATLDMNKRADVYKQVQKILYEDQPMVVWYSAPQISTVRKNVQNYPQTYNGYWGTRDFERVWKTK
jgi:peptide/nickel transport system substrate-binding protein